MRSPNAIIRKALQKIPERTLSPIFMKQVPHHVRFKAIEARKPIQNPARRKFGQELSRVLW